MSPSCRHFIARSEKDVITTDLRVAGSAKNVIASDPRVVRNCGCLASSSGPVAYGGSGAPEVVPVTTGVPGVAFRGPAPQLLLLQQPFSP